MTRLLLILTLQLLAMTSMAADNEWQPVPSWPFIYQKFQKAIIYTTTDKKITADANVHIKQGQLWFVSSKDKNTKLQAATNIIRKVVFADGNTFMPIENRLCAVVREDTVASQISRLYHDVRVDMDRYNEMAESNMGAIAEGIDLPGMDFADFTIDVANRNSAEIIDGQPLPIKEKFYITYHGDTFEFSEGAVLKHLKKEERAAYRSYTRKAEVISSNIDSAMDVYTTFFLK